MRVLVAVVALALAAFWGCRFGSKPPPSEGKTPEYEPPTKSTRERPSHDWIREQITIPAEAQLPDLGRPKPVLEGTIYYLKRTKDYVKEIYAYSLKEKQHDKVGEIEASELYDVCMSQDGELIFYLGRKKELALVVMKFDSETNRYREEAVFEWVGIHPVPPGMGVLYDDWQRLLYVSVGYCYLASEKEQLERFSLYGKPKRLGLKFSTSNSYRRTNEGIRYPFTVSENACYYGYRNDRGRFIEKQSKDGGAPEEVLNLTPYGGSLLITEDEEGCFILVNGGEEGHYEGYVYYVPFGSDLKRFDFSKPHWILPRGVDYTTTKSPSGLGYLAISEEYLGSDAGYACDVFLFDMTTGELIPLFIYETTSSALAYVYHPIGWVDTREERVRESPRVIDFSPWL